MTEKQIGKHREKHLLKYNQITAYSSFTQVLGMKPEDYTPQQRKERWNKNMFLLNEIEPELANYWRFQSEECCAGCIHRNINGNHWCNYAELPCFYNPVMKMSGMACCGLGYENSLQKSLFEDVE